MQSRTVLTIGGGTALAVGVAAATVIGVTGTVALEDHPGHAVGATAVVVHRTADPPETGLSDHPASSTADTGDGAADTDRSTQTVSAPSPRDIGSNVDAPAEAVDASKAPTTSSGMDASPRPTTHGAHADGARKGGSADTARQQAEDDAREWARTVTEDAQRIREKAERVAHEHRSRHRSPAVRTPESVTGQPGMPGARTHHQDSSADKAGTSSRSGPPRTRSGSQREQPHRSPEGRG